MRLGELLLQRQLVTREQLRAALDQQRAFGRRLGTNLVELGFVEVDAISRALAEQKGVPPALAKHVAAIDKRVLSLFPARAVVAYKVVPLGYTTSSPSRVIIACIDPAVAPVEELAFVAGSRVDVWVAPELLVEQAIERYFGAPRGEAKFVEVFFGNPPSTIPPPLERGGNDLSPPSAVSPSSGRSSSGKVPPGARPLLPGLTPPPPPLLAPSPPAPSPPTRASLSLPPAPISPRHAPRPPLSPPPPPDSTPFAKSGQTAHVRAVAKGPSMHPNLAFDADLPSERGWDAPEAAEDSEASSGPISAPADLLRPIIDQSEASRLLEMATTKDRVGTVLADWLRSAFGCGLVLVVKNDLAVGWKGFFSDAEELIEAVAVPLGRPSMFAMPFEAREPFCGPPPESRTNHLFWKLLRCQQPSEVIVCPVVIGKRAVNLLYAHAADDSPLGDTQFREAQVLAGDAGAAYLRIIRRERAK